MVIRIGTDKYNECFSARIPPPHFSEYPSFHHSSIILTPTRLIAPRNLVPCLNSSLQFYVRVRPPFFPMYVPPFLTRSALTIVPPSRIFPFKLSHSQADQLLFLLLLSPPPLPQPFSRSASPSCFLSCFSFSFPVQGFYALVLLTFFFPKTERSARGALFFSCRPRHLFFPVIFRPRWSPLIWPARPSLFRLSECRALVQCSGPRRSLHLFVSEQLFFGGSSPALLHSLFSKFKCPQWFPLTPSLRVFCRFQTPTSSRTFLPPPSPFPCLVIFSNSPQKS